MTETQTRDSQPVLNCLRLASEAVHMALEKTPHVEGSSGAKLRTKAEILTALRARHEECPEEELESAIYRAARLAFRISAISQNLTEETPPGWPNDKTVAEYAGIVFNAGPLSSSSSPSLSSASPVSEPDASEVAGIQSRLTHRLTTVNIEKYTNITIKETQYLRSHLKLIETFEYITLYVFRDTRWLLDAVEMANFPIPREILQETIDTLNYLYPRDGATKRLLRQQGIKLHVFQRSIPDRPRFRDFKYYKPRMVDVAYEFLNPPRRWGTVWKDSRNPVQFWTFWLGLLIFLFTLAFGIMATVLAGLQLHVALHPPKEG
ncbi:hypothetical protein GQ607_012809 [Colletotrichum asianum]|uniref:Uncharacterized protein n=1 Tax=Colletotrichum asianum TaxID=702518 RepID=A0A8H3W0H3_9PEZI|nr:hypothetical protein GQ607_012809 [Colletotrichum asianum]